MSEFKGAIWEQLYHRYGTITGGGAWNTAIIRVVGYIPMSPVFVSLGERIPEVKEMIRIGVELEEGFRALLTIFCERKNATILYQILNFYFTHPIWSDLRRFHVPLDKATIVMLIFDHGFREAFLHAPVRNLFYGAPRIRGFMKTCAVWTRVSESVFMSNHTNILGLIIGYESLEKTSVRMDIIKYFLEIGVEMQRANIINSSLTLCLLKFHPIELLELLSEHDVNFGWISPCNRMQIPDSVVVSIYYNPNLLPFVLKVGGLCITVPVDVATTQHFRDMGFVWWQLPEPTAIFYRFVCCELNRCTGLLRVMSEFCLLLPLCCHCKRTSGLESSIPTLQSLCRMTFRSQFTSSQRLRNELPFPPNYPELYREYLLFEPSPFNSSEFIEVLAERDSHLIGYLSDYMEDELN